MGRYATEGSSGSFTPAPAGTHVARCYKIIDIGTHHSEYQGKATVRNQVIISWEIPAEMIDTSEGPQPAVASRFYTNSLNEKATLRADLEAWRGKKFTPEELQKFDLSKLIGHTCMLTIIEGEQGKTKIASIGAMPKGMTCLPPVNDPVQFWIDEWDQAKFDGLTDGIKKFIMDSDEYKMMAKRRQFPVANPIGDEQHFADSDIPF